MIKSRKTINVISLVLYILGGVLGVVFIAISSWGGMEGAFFDHVPNSDKMLTSLQCPLVISKNETATISATVYNNSKYTVRPTITANISSGFFIVSDQISNRYTIEPHSPLTLDWQADINNAAYNQTLIMVHVKVLSSWPLPAMTGNCGIVVMDLGPFSGKFIATAVSLAAMILLSLGWWLWYRNHQVEKSEQTRGASNGLRALALIILVGILAGFLKLWFLGIIALGVILILSIILWSLYTTGVS